MEKSEVSVTKQENNDMGANQWVLYIDGASNEKWIRSRNVVNKS